jgi:hypothetical protein
MNFLIKPLSAALLAAIACASAASPSASTSPAGPQAAAAAVATTTAAPLDAAERRAAIEQIAHAMETTYVFPEIAAKYASALRAASAAGEYDGITDPAAFAARVTADLQAVAADRHVRVMLAQDLSAAMRRMGPGGAPALEEAKMIADGVAYLRFNLLPDDPATARAAREFLLANADARAVVIDSRPNRGGMLTVMDAILPLFYDEPTTLLRMDTRGAGAPPRPPGQALVAREAPDGISRHDHVVTPDPEEGRLKDAQLYYLISSSTGSAAEHLALALKRTGRATLVGETTAGAGHYGRPIPVGRFSVFVPFGRTYDPDTGKGWEGTGVAPDVATPADRALDVALSLATASADQTTGGR